MLDEIGRHRGADFSGGGGVAGTTSQIGHHVAGPVGQIRRGERRRPAAPEQRSPADTVSEPGEWLVADPRHSPNHVLYAAGIIACAQVTRAADFAAQLLRQVLDVRLQQKGSGIEQQNAQCGAATLPIQLFGAIAAEHAGADNHGVEGISSDTLGGGDFLPIVANVTWDDVVAEIALLNVVAGGIGTSKQLIERHVDLPN